MKKALLFFSTTLLFLSMCLSIDAQQYKLKQSTSVMGMKMESTIYVKGMRKRTEPGAMMGMPTAPITIEQCDLQRTIKINDKKKLYFIEPFAKETEEVIDEDAKPVPTKNKPVTPKENPVTQKVGTIHMWYSITDTGERKKMYGFVARHVWTSQKIKPSPDACTMKDSIIMKTDGWYIDLPQFNCPVHYRPSRAQMPPTQKQQPDCMDKFVTHRSGKGKLGFPLIETTTIIMGASNAKMGEIQTNIETVEFSAEKLDSMLFEIPPGYTETTNEEDLQNKMNMSDMMEQAKNMSKNQAAKKVGQQKSAGVIRIGVYEPKADGQIQTSEQQQNLVNDLNVGTVEAVAVASEEDARKLNCDYTLSTEFLKFKSGSKVGGILKAIKNTDPNAASSFNIEASLTLTKLADGSVKTQQKVSGKYEGKADEAAKKALDEGSNQVLQQLK